MELRLKFNEDEENYDKIRPPYPDDLYADIIAYSNIDISGRGLEIGIGTGQATVPFLNRGCSITAVELGDRFSRYVERKFKAYRNFHVINADFMQWPFQSNSFGMVYCATAFHWLPAEAAYLKIFDVLLENGTVALFWNHPYPNRKDDPTNVVNSWIYNRYRPSDKPSREFCEKDCQRRIDELETFGFKDVRAKLYYRTRTLSSNRYIDLLNTYSDHRALPNDTKVAFEREMKKSLDQVGGIINIYDTLDLYLARK